MARNAPSLASRFSLLASVRSSRGTAAIETALIMPLYMLVLLGVIYFGYATLTKQRQTVSAAGAAWMPGTQDADALREEYWRLAGGIGADMTIVSAETIRLDDPYYGNIIPTQLAAGAAPPPGDNSFYLERITVGLWNHALGEMYQRFVFRPGQGFVEEIGTNWDDYARYLNVNSGAGTGWIDAREGAPPQVTNLELSIAATLNGSRASSDRWLERRQVTIDANYRPPFFRQIMRDPAETGRSDLPTYVSGDYAEPAQDTNVSMTFDLTARGSANRYAVAEGALPEDLVVEASSLLDFGTPLSPADALDGLLSVAVGGGDPWTAQ